MGTKGPLNKWWVIGVFLASVLFFVIGGALIGVWANSASCTYHSSTYYYNYTECSGGNRGAFYGGIAMLVLASILKVIFWILLIVWCVKRRHARASSTVIYVNNNSNPEAAHLHPQANVYTAPQANYSGVPQQDYNLPPAQEYSSGQPIPVYGSAPVAEKQTVTRYCGNCGTPTTTGSCSRCGTQVL